MVCTCECAVACARHVWVNAFMCVPGVGMNAFTSTWRAHANVQLQIPACGRGSNAPGEQAAPPEGIKTEGIKRRGSNARGSNAKGSNSGGSNARGSNA